MVRFFFSCLGRQSLANLNGISLVFPTYQIRLHVMNTLAHTPGTFATNINVPAAVLGMLSYASIPWWYLSLARRALDWPNM